MSDLLGVTLDQMVSGLKARRVRIPAEIGAYVALEVAEQLERWDAVGAEDVRRVIDRVLSGPRVLAAVGPLTKASLRRVTG